MGKKVNLKKARRRKINPERAIVAMFRGMKKKSLNQVVRLICGEKIGSGLYRDVYVLKGYPEYVVKVEVDPSTGTFANVLEWNNYLMHGPWIFLGPWLAGCVAINETGRVLIQQRIEHRGPYPGKIPRMFTDLKRANFGYIGERFVCCDYSFLVLPKFPTQMQKARWWGRMPKSKKAA